VVSLVHEMEKRGLKMGLAALCGGGGHGQAIILQRMWFLSPQFRYKAFPVFQPSLLRRFLAAIRRV